MYSYYSFPDRAIRRTLYGFLALVLVWGLGVLPLRGRDTKRHSLSGGSLELDRNWKVETVGTSSIRATRDGSVARLQFDILTQTFTDDLADLSEFIIFEELAPDDNSYKFEGMKLMKEIPDTYYIRDRRMIKGRRMDGAHFVMRRGEIFYSLRYDVYSGHLQEYWDEIIRTVRSVRYENEK